MCIYFGRLAGTCARDAHTWFIGGDMTRISKLHNELLVLLILVVVDNPHLDVASSLNNTHSSQLQRHRRFNLARSPKLPTGLYILPSVISFFFYFFFFFFNDFSETKYLWTDFRNLFTE